MHLASTRLHRNLQRPARTCSRVRRIALGLSLTAITLLPACKSMAGSYKSAAPGMSDDASPDASYDEDISGGAMYDEYGEYGESEELDDADEYTVDGAAAPSMDAPPEPEPEPMLVARAMQTRGSARRERRAMKREQRADLQKQKTDAPTKTTPKNRTSKETRADKAKDTPDETPDEIARQVIYTAGMTVGVFKVARALERAEAIASAVGGYVERMSSDTIVLRIPAPALADVMTAYAELGVVETRSLEARDVTDEYVDLRSRILVLRETRDQLRALLKQARTVDQALQIRAVLDQVNMDLERAEARLRVLKSLVAFSTLTVMFVERGPHTEVPTGNDPFPWVDDLGVEATEFR
jgi:hypothetical protein